MAEITIEVPPEHVGAGAGLSRLRAPLAKAAAIVSGFALLAAATAEAHQPCKTKCSASLVAKPKERVWKSPERFSVEHGARWVAAGLIANGKSVQAADLPTGAICYGEGIAARLSHHGPRPRLTLHFLSTTGEAAQFKVVYRVGYGKHG